jgi:hypothetical protein
MNVCLHTEIATLPDFMWKAKTHRLDGGFREASEDEDFRFAVDYHTRGKMWSC